MLDYTIVATQKTVDDIKRFSFVFTLLTQALYIDYNNKYYATCYLQVASYATNILMCIAVDYWSVIYFR